MTQEDPATDSPASGGGFAGAARAGCRNVGIIASAVVLVYCIAGAFDPPRLNWGDTGSDYNTMIAGRNFAKYGFVNMRFTPHLIDTAVWTKADSGLLYTHYPQLPDLMNGVQRKIFGMYATETPFRLVALVFSFGALFFVYRLIVMYWSRQTAQIAIALWVTNSVWIQHADYLHHGPYGAFFGFGSIYFLARSLRDDRHRWYFAASGLFLFLAYCSSYDYWIFLPLLLAAVLIAHFGGVFKRAVARRLGMLGAFALAAILLKTATNIWAFGSVARFVRDLHFQAVERSTDSFVHTSFSNGIVPTLFGRVDREFTLLLFPLIALWLAFPMIRKRLSGQMRALQHPIPNPVVLLLAALPFLCLFPELWVAQYYPFLMVMPFYAVGFATLAVVLLDSSSRAVKALAIAVLAALTINSVDEIARFKKTFFDRDAIRTLRVQIDSLAPAGRWVLANNILEAQYRFYLDRNIVPLIVYPFPVMPEVMAHFSDPGRPQFAGADGSVFVQHKHLTDQVFDKYYYHVVARNQLWRAWGNPQRYRPLLDGVVAGRDSAMTAMAARVGTKVYESDYYILWRIYPSEAARSRALLNAARP